MSSTTWTKLQYLRRFTQAERIAIRSTATQSAELADYLELLALAEEVKSDDPDILVALNMLEGAGLLASGRANEILSDPVPETPTEPTAFVATHRVTLNSERLDACADPDGTVRLSNGKWTTLDTLAALSIVLEVI